MEYQLLTLDEVAWRLRLSHMTIYRMIQRGEIRAVKIGNQWRFSSDAIYKWLDKSFSLEKRPPVSLATKRKSSWETKYGPASHEYLQDIFDTRPDILALLERRGERGFAAFAEVPPGHRTLICGFQALELMPDADINRQYIALADDSKQHGHTLHTKRGYLEARGARVRTFAFMGCEPSPLEKAQTQDPETQIYLKLADSDFTTACAELTDHLLMQGRTQDTDHFTVSLALSGKGSPAGLKEFLELLGELGTVFIVPSPAEENGIITITLDRPDFLQVEAKVGGLPIVLVFQDGVVKFRFYYHIQDNTFSCLALPMPKATLNIQTYFDNEARESSLPLNLKKMGLKYDQLSESQKALACYRDLSLNLSLIMLEQLIRRLNAKDSPSKVWLVDPLVSRDDLQYSYPPELGKKLSEYIVQYLSKVAKIQEGTTRQYKMFIEQTETLLPFLSESRTARRQLEAVRHILPVVRLLVQETGKGKEGLTFSEICQRLEGQMEQWEVSFAFDLGLDRTLIAPLLLQRRLSDGVWEFRRGYRPGEAAPGDPPEQVGHGTSKALDSVIRRFRRDKFLVPFVLDRLMQYCPNQREGVEPFLANKVMTCLILDWLRKPDRREWSAWEAPPDEFGPLPQIPLTSSTLERGGNLYQLAQNGKAFFEFKATKQRRQKHFVPIDGWKKVVSDYYDKDELANIDAYLRVYSAIFNRLDSSKGRPAVDNLLTLSACFDEESTYKYAHYNLRLWEERLGHFLDLCRNKFAGRRVTDLKKTISDAERTSLQAIGDTDRIIGKIPRYDRVADTKEALEQDIEREGDMVLSEVGKAVLSRIVVTYLLPPRLLTMKQIGELMKATATMIQYMFSRVWPSDIADTRNEAEKNNRLDHYLARVREKATGLVKDELLKPFDISDDSLDLAVLPQLLDSVGTLYKGICHTFHSQCPPLEPILDVNPLGRLNWVNFVGPQGLVEDSTLMFIGLDKLNAGLSSLSPLETNRVVQWNVNGLAATISQFEGKTRMQEGNGNLVVFKDERNALRAAIQILQEVSGMVESMTLLPICIGVSKVANIPGGRVSKKELESKIAWAKKLAQISPSGLYIAENLTKTVEELGLSNEICPIPGAIESGVEEKVIRVHWSVASSTLSGRPSALSLQPTKRLEKLAPMKTLQILDSYSKDEEKAGIDLSHFQFVLIPHFVEDLYGFLLALDRVGVGPSNTCLLYKPYPYKKGEDIKRTLKDLHYSIFPLEQKEGVLDEVVNKARISRKQIIVIEDGGYITPLIHKKYLGEIKLFRGVVEQTMKGVVRVKEQVGENNIKVPYRNVAESKIKAGFESPAVAEAAIANIRQFLSEKNFAGESVGVIGYGHIGQHLASGLKAMKAIVHVQDIDIFKLELAKRDGYITVDLCPDLVEKCWLVLGATGQMTIGRDEILRLQPDSVLVSVSSDQEEISPEILKTFSADSRKGAIGTEYTLFKQSKKVLLLGDGFPINFVGAQGIPNEIIDLVLTELYLNMIELVRKQHPVGERITAEDVDKLAEEKGLMKHCRELHRR